ncbi:MAG: prolipoprotein diacylglyceryl transferase [Deltaproteobacteria bacterium]|nr:prolipoprotein diacylglyceryl transferase [Deltaproteobacteria bacterium]
MHPILFELGPFKLYTYGLLVALGFASALWIGGREARRYGIDAKEFQDLCFAILVSAVLGARLFFVLLEWRYFAANPGQILALWKGGLVFYGGFIGAALAAVWFVRRHHLPLWDTADAIAPGLVLGQALGRVGCFFAGCCYGAECHLPWAVTFTNPRSLARLGVPLHPTQLYESAAAFALFAILYGVVGRRRRFEGQVFGAYLTAYPALRFTVEIFRDDPRGSLGPLSTSQALGIPLFLFGLWILYSQSRGHARPGA